MPYKKPGDIFVKDNVVYRIKYTRLANPCMMCDFKTNHNNICSCNFQTGINSEISCAILIGEHSYLKEVKGGL